MFQDRGLKVGFLASAAFVPLLAGLTFPSAAAAQDSSASKVEQVVVTAQRREERLQDVPLSVVALSADMLETRKINSSEDLADSLPGLVNVSNQSSGSFAIRGQGPSFGSAPGAYLYFADVPMLSIPTNTEPSGIDSRPGTFFDMANVQLLKGPQGTLFGRNATGGNILFVPKRPTNELGGYIQGEIGNYADRAVEGAYNIPIIDNTLMVRLSGAMQVRDGFVKDFGTIYHGKDYENLNYYTGRLSVDYKPSENFDNYFIARYYSSNDNGPGYIEAAINPTAPAGINTLFPNRLSDFANQVAAGPRGVAYDSNSYDRMNYWQLINTATYSFSDHLSLKNIFSYANAAESLGLDVDGSPEPILNQTNAFRHTPHAEIETGELQLAGDALDKHLIFSLGAYADQGRIAHRTYDFDFYPFVPGNGALGLPPVGVKPSPGYPLYLDLNGETNSEALYGQATFDFGQVASTLEGLKLTGGYRYTWERGSAFQQLAFSSGLSGSPGTWSNDYGSYNLTLNYQISSDAMIYASQRDASKSGGVNVQLKATDPNRFYQPEHLVSREIGAKVQGEWGIIDIDGFFGNYQNIQRSVNDPARAVAAFTTNVARAEIKGIEANGTLFLGPRLQLNGNIAYTDSGYTKITDPAAVATLTGANLPFVSKIKYIVGGTVFLLQDNPYGDVSFTTSYSYTGKISATQTNTSGLLGSFFPSIDLLNLALEWKQHDGGPFSARFYVTNAADELYRAGTYDFSGGDGFVTNRYGPPRMFGLQLRYQPR